MGRVTFRDNIVHFRLIAFDARQARRFFRHLKQKLKRELSQEEILIVETEVKVL